MDKDFLWGAATSSFQIEGASDADGRTECIWDEFCRQSGAISDGTDGLTACDHYHRYKEDVALLKELGVDCYRFSISWPRIFPREGEYNAAGMDFYKSLIKELADAGIKSSVTLYHWDLPVWAQKKGGWENRESVKWFADYAKVCFDELGDSVCMWITHNEPWCASFLSNMLGEHAPGKRDPQAGLVTAHNILLSHGAAVDVYRSTGLKAPIGITLNMTYSVPASDCFADRLAASNDTGWINGWFYEPLFRGTYPADIANLFGAMGCNFDYIQQGDFERISRQIDFIGINYYAPSYMKFNNKAGLLGDSVETGRERTAMDWEIMPYGLAGVIEYARKYTELPVYITENGSAWDDTLENDGIHDKKRVDYLLKHLDIIRQMNESGRNVKGYFAWSLLDNFEWSYGYSKRFGIVYMDYKTLKRTPKDSFKAYRDYIKQAKK